ncbi:MAG: 2-oxoglutarate dehydrogenase complex dihydrolipoyllysine-residue succinyltransferase [Alphaproteobacteria bacterium]|nr:2-oxoglutarate dehydrogenase complex dihydrolipoyllysine-residue succinyltransferase [Alphaproteobacteria bacterium]MBL6776116.1 2-oxoglutarate dehydrogenase complex dihydrolipoyllysine-residue succinyltransferase [Alphaproteobacteria bacterium]
MAVEIKVPVLGESVVEATVAKWMKGAGEAVAADEAIVELETDKVTLEVPSPVNGVLSDIVASEGATVEVGALLGMVEEGAAATSTPASKPAVNPAANNPAVNNPAASAPEAASPTPASAPASAPAPAPSAAAAVLSPAVRKLVEENNLNPGAISGTGKDGRLTKADVQKAIASGSAKMAAASSAPAPAKAGPRASDAREERVPMSRLRRMIAGRLKEAQNTAAMLTTFNEVDMSAVMALRSEYKDDFEKQHGARLGFMGFFVRAVIRGLQEFPAVNAEIHGDDIIYKNFYNIGVAVGTPQGLVVPVVRDAQDLSLADIEKQVTDYGIRARDGKLTPADMAGGSFTISNGGVYGSLMSTPILNPPQSGILGMHKIQKRPIAIGDKVEVRPMMYLALSYDHRIIDGREAVSFLVRVKDSIEDPRRLLLGV